MKSEKLLDYIGSVDDKYIKEMYEDMEAESIKGAKVIPISKHSSWKKWVALAACLAVVIVAGVAVVNPFNKVEPYEGPANEVIVNDVNNSIVIIDVNPSIQLIISDDGTVQSVTPLNDDASNLLSGYDFTGMSCDEAVNAIVSLLKENEYITPSKNSILVSVVGSNETSAEVKDMVTTAVENANTDSDYNLSVLSQTLENSDEYYNLGKDLGISAGKTALIEDITDNSEEYSVSDLASLNIHALNQIMNYMGLSVIDTSGEVAGSITEEVSKDLNISDMDYEDALDLAVSMSDAYDSLCDLHPEIDTATYIGYDFSLKCKTVNGSKVWSIIAENKNDNGLPSVSIELNKDLIPTEAVKAGADMIQNSLKLACDVFGLITNNVFAQSQSASEFQQTNSISQISQDIAKQAETAPQSDNSQQTDMSQQTDLSQQIKDFFAQGQND